MKYQKPNAYYYFFRCLTQRGELALTKYFNAKKCQSSSSEHIECTVRVVSGN